MALVFSNTAEIRIGNDIRKFKVIKKGVRQGCMILSDIFQVYI